MRTVILDLENYILKEKILIYGESFVSEDSEGPYPTPTPIPLLIPQRLAKHL